MKLQLIAVGTKMPKWVEDGFLEYKRRFPHDMPLELVEIPAGKRGKNADIARILQKEGEAMLASIPKGNRIITLDIPGKKWDTPQLAQQLESWKLDGRDVSILIGGPEGLAPACKSCRRPKLVAVCTNTATSVSKNSYGRKPIQSLEHNRQSPISPRISSQCYESVPGLETTKQKQNYLKVVLSSLSLESSLWLVC